MTLVQRFDALDLAAIDEFITDQQEENLHLDFKEADPRLSRDDRQNLAKAISGFANADGGLIVWGVQARPNDKGEDCASERKEIQPVSLLMSKLNQHTGDAATPIVDGVRHKKIETDDDRGFAITLVPASDAGPHMAKLGQDRYFKRSGSQFRKMEHFEIADMFGRRKRPVLSLKWRAQFESEFPAGDQQFIVVLAMLNSGRGSANAPFLHVCLEPPYALSHRFDGSESLPRLASGMATPGVSFGGKADIIIHPGMSLDVATVQHRLHRSRATLEDFVVRYAVAAEDQDLLWAELRVPGSELIAALRGPKSPA
jgi:hypothetical protein